MKTIWEYNLKLTNEQVIEIPENAAFLSVQVQEGSIVVWAMVNPDAIKQNYVFSIVGTGSEVPDRAGIYLGTLQVGWFVWHVFVIEEGFRNHLEEVGEDGLITSNEFYRM